MKWQSQNFCTQWMHPWCFPWCRHLEKMTLPVHFQWKMSACHFSIFKYNKIRDHVSKKLDKKKIGTKPVKRNLLLEFAVFGAYKIMDTSALLHLHIHLCFAFLCCSISISEYPLLRPRLFSLLPLAFCWWRRAANLCAPRTFLDLLISTWWGWC